MACVRERHAHPPAPSSASHRRAKSLAAHPAADIDEADFVLTHLLDRGLKRSDLASLHRGTLTTLSAPLDALLAAPDAPLAITVSGRTLRVGPSPLAAAALQLKCGLVDAAGSLVPTCTRLRAWTLGTEPTFPSHPISMRLEGTA